MILSLTSSIEQALQNIGASGLMLDVPATETLKNIVFYIQSLHVMIVVWSTEIEKNIQIHSS